MRAAPQPAHRPLPPAELKTIKRAIRAVNAHQADAALCAWLRQETAAGRASIRHLAIDGKAVRGARSGGGHAPHLLAAYDTGDGSVAAQLDVEVKHNEITDFADLLACLDIPGGGGADDDDDGGITLITADALHTQTAHVEAMNAAGLDWMLIAKGNQPGLEEQICSHDWESFPPSRH